MSKPISERTHAKRIRADQATSKMSEADIRRASCQRSRQRNAAKQTERREAAEQRNAELAKLSPAERLKQLTWRVGATGAKRERARLLTIIQNQKENA